MNIQYLPFTDISSMPQTACMPPDSFNTSGISFDAANVYPAASTNYSVSYAYDKIGTITNLIDWTGETLYCYDRLNRCTMQSVNHTLLTPNLQYSRSYAYDIIDNRTNMELSVEVSGGTFSVLQAYGYDTLNRLTNIIASTSTLSSDPINTVYRYNQNGKLSSKYTTDDGLLSRDLYTYDTEQRLKSMITSNTSSRLIELAYEYNDAQQITQILERVQVDNNVFRSSTNAFIYDNRDQLSKEHHYSSIATLQYTNKFTYDNAQNRTTRTLKGLDETSKTDTYFYAVANKLKAIDESKQYDDDGIYVSDELYHGTDPCDRDTDNDGWDDDTRSTQPTPIPGILTLMETGPLTVVTQIH